MVIRVDGWWKPHEDGKFLRQLHLSVNNRHLIKYHLEKYYNTNSLDNFGRSPLILACLIRCRTREIKVLLDAGAEVNAVWDTKNPFGRISPLGLAVHFKDPGLARFFLNYGADPDLKLFNGNTALHLAIIHDVPLLIDMLLEAEASPTVKNDFGYTPLHLAALSSLDVLKKVFKVADQISPCAREGETPLHVAAYGDKLDNVKFFIQKRADVNFVMRGGLTPHDCSPVGSKTRKFLLDYSRWGKCSCDQNKKSDWVPFSNYYPSHLMALMRAVAPMLLSEILSEHSIVTELNKYNSPHPEAQAYQPSKHCPTVNIDPPWHWVPPITNFPNPAIQLLTADISRATPPLQQSFESVLKKLTNGDVMDPKLFFVSLMVLVKSWGAFTCSNEALALGGLCLKLLLSAGADVNGKDENGYTPLAVLIEDGYESAAVYLLNSGADPELKVAGVTPLMLATARGLREVVSTLIQLGVNVNALDKNGVTALHIAAYYSFLSPPEVMKALIDGGAALNAKGPTDVTPLHLSALSMSGDTSRVLLNAGAYIDLRIFDLKAVDLAFLFMNIPAAAILKLTGDMFRYDPDYQVADKNGLTAFHHAVKRKNYCTLVMYLKKWGATMLFEEGNVNHIDNLIKIAEESSRRDSVMPGETLYTLHSWKACMENQGPERLAQLINKQFYDYVGFATLVLKRGWYTSKAFFEGRLCGKKKLKV